MLFIYTQKITNRVTYIFDLIFKTILNVDYKITSDKDLFSRHDGPGISYGDSPLGNELFFQCNNLLFEKGITKEALNLEFSRNPESLPSDPFALSFLLVTRYEEYLPFTPDQYGRFSAQKSLAHKNNFLQKPVVNIWTEKIKDMILIRYPSFSFPTKKYSYTPTIDIDNAYAYLGKSFARTLGGYAKSMINFDMDNFFKRKNVLSGREKDPYDTYDFQIEAHKKYNLKPVYFFLLGDWDTYDKNLPHSNPKIQELIKNISQNAETCIHPSFASNQHPRKIGVEKKRLEKIKNTEVDKSRQHFLMLRFPETYRNLISSGITDDYTMGFADDTGFRAGICTSYRFYDLEKEMETGLSVHPFAVMDGTLNNYLKLTPELALERVMSVVREIKRVNGEFFTIWHNETLSDWREWKGWRSVYEKTLEIAV